MERVIPSPPCLFFKESEKDMPITSSIRIYPNLEAVRVHLGSIEKQVQRLSVLAASPAFNQKAVRIGEMEPKKPVKTLSPKLLKSVETVHESLKKLTEQRDVLSNMLLNINTNFSDDDVDKKLLDTIRNSISKLQKEIQASLKNAYQNADSTAQIHLAPHTIDLAKKLSRFFNKKLDKTASFTFTSGVQDKTPVMVIFVIYEQVKNSSGEIDPKIVMALSQLGKKVFFNPGLVNTRLVGQFKLGFELPDMNPEKIMLDLARNQLTADAHLSVVQPKLVPETVSPTTLKITDINKVKVEDTSVHVTFKNTIKTEKDAQEKAQEIYRILHTHMKGERPRQKDRIVYALQHNGVSWGAVFRFATGDAFSGRTLDKMEMEKLSNILDENELKVFRRAINAQ